MAKKTSGTKTLAVYKKDGDRRPGRPVLAMALREQIEAANDPRVDWVDGGKHETEVLRYHEWHTINDRIEALVREEIARELEALAAAAYEPQFGDFVVTPVRLRARAAEIREGR
jgi:hypothetical protein